MTSGYGMRSTKWQIWCQNHSNIQNRWQSLQKKQERQWKAGQRWRGWTAMARPWNKRRRSSLQWPVLLPLPQQSGNHGNQWQALQSGSGILRLILQLLHCLARKIASRSLLRCGFQMVAIVFANPLHPILSNSAGVTSSSKTKTLTDPNCAH